MDKLVRKIEIPLAKKAIPTTPVTHYAMARHPKGE